MCLLDCLMQSSCRYVTIPPGNIGLYDPTVIRNRGNISQFQRETYVKLGYHLLETVLIIGTWVRANFSWLLYKRYNAMCYYWARGKLAANRGDLGTIVAITVWPLAFNIHSIVCQLLQSVTQLKQALPFFARFIIVFHRIVSLARYLLCLHLF